MILIPLKRKPMSSDGCTKGFWGFPYYGWSPTKAPIEGPKIIPNGPRNRPISIPTVAPRDPALVPPARLVNQTGATPSKRLTPIVTSKLRIKVVVVIPLREEKRAISNPAQAKGSPGRTGRKLPRNQSAAPDRQKLGGEDPNPSLTTPLSP